MQTMTQESMTTATSPELQSSSSQKQLATVNDSLLNRLGGEVCLEAVVLDFYDRIMADKELQRFFENVDMGLMRLHQKKFLILAFTEIPEGFNLSAYMIERHYRLFAMGLNETHFDLVAGHLVAALNQMWVEKEVIDEVVGLLGPVRAVFEEAGRADKIFDYMEKVVDERRQKKSSKQSSSSTSTSASTSSLSSSSTRKGSVHGRSSRSSDSKNKNENRSLSPSKNNKYDAKKQPSSSSSSLTMSRHKDKSSSSLQQGSSLKRNKSKKGKGANRKLENEHRMSPPRPSKNPRKECSKWTERRRQQQKRQQLPAPRSWGNLVSLIKPKLRKLKSSEGIELRDSTGLRRSQSMH